jgi:hypothetical protein
MYLKIIMEAVLQSCKTKLALIINRYRQLNTLIRWTVRPTPPWTARNCGEKI